MTAAAKDTLMYEDPHPQRVHSTGGPLDCEEVRRLLDPYLDGELSPEEAASVEHHLLSCRKCAFESTQVVRLKEVITRWKGPDEERLRSKVLEKVREELARSGPPLQRHRRRVAIASAFLLIVTAGLGMLVYHIAGGGSGMYSAASPKPAQAPQGTAFPTSRIIAESISGNGVQVVENTGRIRPLSPGAVLHPGEMVEVTEDSTATLKIKGGRLVLGALSWQGKASAEAPPAGLTRILLPETGPSLILQRGTVRISARGKGTGGIRLLTPAGTFYAPRESGEGPPVRAVVHAGEHMVAVRVLSGRAGFIRTSGKATRDMGLQEGRLVEFEIPPSPLPLK